MVDRVAGTGRVLVDYRESRGAHGVGTDAETVAERLYEGGLARSHGRVERHYAVACRKLQKQIAQDRKKPDGLEPRHHCHEAEDQAQGPVIRILEIGPVRRYDQGGQKGAERRGEKHRLSPGDVFLVLPGETHYYADANRLGIYNILFSRNFFSRLLAEFRGAAEVEAYLGLAPAGENERKFEIRHFDNRTFFQVTELLDEIRNEEQENHSGARLMVGLGGALDVFAGAVERAPEKWQKAGLEWAYRLKKEPKRIGRMAKLPLVLVKAAGRRVTGKGRQGVL